MEAFLLGSSESAWRIYHVHDDDDRHERDASSPKPPPRAWHILRRGRVEGPVSEPALLDLIESGQLDPTDCLWRPGMQGWVAAGEVPGIFSPPPLGEEIVPNEQARAI
jgi:hypothetical protein